MTTNRVRRFLIARAHRENGPIQIRLDYLLADPLALRFVFRQGRTSHVTWQVGRELVERGLTVEGSLVGEGDVRIGPDPDCTCGGCVLLALDSPDGSAAFTLPRARLVAFLSETYELVGLEREVQLVDDALEAFVLEVQAEAAQ